MILTEDEVRAIRERAKESSDTGWERVTATVICFDVPALVASHEELRARVERLRVAFECNFVFEAIYEAEGHAPEFNGWACGGCGSETFVGSRSAIVHEPTCPLYDGIDDAKGS